MSYAYDIPLSENIGPFFWFFTSFNGIFYGLRNKHHTFLIGYSSLQSWLFAAVPFFLVIALPAPWPLIGITLLGIASTKSFFQLMGIYHRSYFLLTCYLGILCLALCIYWNHLFLYNLVPMGVFTALCLRPILMNSYKHMLQYLSLSLFSFIFLGWGGLHLALILQKSEGIFLLFYLSLLIELFDNGNLILSSILRGKKFLSKINSYRTTYATMVAFGLTVLLAFPLQNFILQKVLVHHSYFWLISSFLAAMGTMMGTLIMDVIRKDIGVRVTGVFIIGKADFVHRMQRMVFTVPFYYYFIEFYG